jgi:hypothetical protein
MADPQSDFEREVLLRLDAMAASLTTLGFEREVIQKLDALASSLTMLSTGMGQGFTAVTSAVGTVSNQVGEVSGEVTSLTAGVAEIEANVLSLAAQEKACCAALEVKLNTIIQMLINLNPGKAVDLDLVVKSLANPSTKGTNAMAGNKKASGPAIKCPCLKAPGGPKQAVMPTVTLTLPLPASIALQPINASGGNVTIAPTDSVTGTLVSDSPNLVIAQAADSLHYTGTIPANTPFGSVANLAATLIGTIQNAPANFTASVQVVIDLPAVPVATDLDILFS